MLITEKRKAEWITAKKAAIQFVISLKSYLVYPFCQTQSNATKMYFSKIYDGTRIDDYIFDGNDHAYLKKINHFFQSEDNLNTASYKYIYDCGCGNCSFLSYLSQKGVNYEQYIGIDFARSPLLIDENIQIIQSDIDKYTGFDQSDSHKLVVLCNVICYLPTAKFESLLKRIQTKNTSVLIIDPVPSVFWDATFDHVRLYYRDKRKVDGIMKKNGFNCKKTSTDYLFKFFGIYSFPLSYGSLYEYMKGDDDMKP